MAFIFDNSLFLKNISTFRTKTYSLIFYMLTRRIELKPFLHLSIKIFKQIYLLKIKIHSVKSKMWVVPAKFEPNQGKAPLQEF